MRRMFAVGALLLACVGCQSSRPFDPFLGRTQVPPPPTGIIGPAGSVAPDSGGFLRQAPATNPATSNQFAPPESQNNLYVPNGSGAAPPVGGYPGYQSSVDPSGADGRRLAAAGNPQFRRASATTQVSGSPATPAASSQPSDIQLAAGDGSASAGSGDAVQTSHTTEIRIVEPSSSGDTSAAAPASGSNTWNARTSSTGSGSTDIMNLPPRGSSSAGSSVTIDGTRQAMRPDFSSEVGASEAYEHTPDYAQLSGRLEYSQSDRQWKLRYIPIDGATDSFGGSVVLDGSHVADYRPNQFVRVRGTLAAANSGSAYGTTGSYSPVYRLDAIEPQVD